MSVVGVVALDDERGVKYSVNENPNRPLSVGVTHPSVGVAMEKETAPRRPWAPRRINRPQYMVR
eukprot:8923100-Pyramimonas_sp.AAC.1